MKILPYILIAAIIFIFNIITIWGLDGLVIDDQAYYFLLFKKSFSDLEFNRNILHAIFTLGIFKIAGFGSIYLARFLIIILLSIPSASFIYYFSNHHFKLKKYASIAIAVIPFILPNEIMVPTYIAGSYMLMAILFTLISIFFILKFSHQTKFSIHAFVFATIFYYMATESSELFALMLPVFLFLIFLFRKLSWSQFSLATMLSLIAVRKAFLIINNPHNKVNSVSNDLSWAEIKNRIASFPGFMNPLEGIADTWTTNILMISIILLGAIAVLLNHKRISDILYVEANTDKFKNKSFYFSYYYLFPAMWLSISIIPFIFFSYFFESRYFIVASIALAFLLVISILVILNMISRRKMLAESVLILLIATAGINRQIEFGKYYKPHNDQFNNLEQTLASCNLPKNAQIVIATPKNVALKIGNGTTRYANGTLQYTLKRRDVKGQIMKELNFYDPFRIYKQSYKFRNANIDTNKNTCLFRCLNNDSSLDRRLNYALRWLDDSDTESGWYIFKYDDLGNRTNFISGKGFTGYERVVDSLNAFGITRNDIMFGGIPDKSDSLRLGL